MDKKKILKLISGLVLAGIALVVTVQLCYWAISLRNEENLALFEDRIRMVGVWGIPIMMIIQVLQVFLAVIPGEPIEIAMGVLYGTWFGCALCLLGIMIGSSLVFVCVKRFGKRFVDKFISGEKFSRLKFLKDPAKRDVLLFVLMFIPGTPKDTLTYFAPFTGISLFRFLVISTIARIPSVISSSYIGSSIIEGNYVKSIIAFVVVGTVSLAGILIYNKIVAEKNKEK
ncbi:MAG: TVP38/TMEM64 family protein [Clostridia bacterium]|nr:TVP38/TMEM64 family protein [Clostridia bacterium]